MIGWDILTVLALGTASVAFIMLGHVERDTIQRTMQRPLFVVKEFTVDLWSLSHMVLYLAIGFTLPNMHFTFLVIGFLFELFEDYLSDPTVAKIFRNRTPLPEGTHSYWYAKFDDPVWNMLGYIIGSSLRTMVS